MSLIAMTFSLTVAIYPNTLGKQNLKGHHFPIDNLKAGVDFIRNSYPEAMPKLDSRGYHTIRNPLHNAQIVFERKKRGRKEQPK